ncbi:hypothetical protein [Anaerostipes faecalis]|uniref:hypothetical protein n=1 Tax=Anaerostipes faecalis TaxID=2738446 RepID=UPI003F093496
MNERNFDEVLLLSPYDDSFPSRLLQEAFEVRVEESREKTEKLFCEMLGKTPIYSTRYHKLVTTGVGESCLAAFGG